MKAAAVQLNSTADRAANIEAADRLVRAAVAEGATLVVLPEKWSAIGSDAQMREAAEDLEGPSVSWARAVARELGIDLVAGSLLERVPGQERLSNTSLHIDAHGEIRASYRKIHMFDVEVEGRAYRESQLEEPGEEIVLSESGEGVQLGLSICYDLRFPELFRILAIRGARVIALPSAFTLPTTRDHWEVLVRARAIEDQVFIVAANQVGAHPGGHHSGGRSLIVDPWGTVLADGGERPGYVTAPLDLERQREVRERLPALASRREEVYRWSHDWPQEVLR